MLATLALVMSTGSGCWQNVQVQEQSLILLGKKVVQMDFKLNSHLLLRTPLLSKQDCTVCVFSLSADVMMLP